VTDVAPPIAVTFFPSFGATRKTEEALTLAELAERIQRSTAPREAALPWLKLARFGDRIEVTAPSEVRAELARIGSELAARYA